MSLNKRNKSELQSDSDQDSDEGANHSRNLPRETKVSWNTPQGQYNIKINFCKDREIGNDHKHVYAKLTLNEKHIGNMSGSIISRPTSYDYSFFEIADFHSQELYDLSRMFCDANGRCTITGLDPSCIYRGGFFHIESVQIDMDHKGYDLGLRLLSEALSDCKDMWVIAVLNAGPLKDHYWSRMNIDLHNEEDKGKIHDATEEAKEKIGRHWARLGFQQAVQARWNQNQYNAWYLTSNHYWNNIPISSSNNCKWKNKEAVKDLDIY